MARFNFGKGSTEDEGIPPEFGEGEPEVDLPEEEDGGNEGTSRWRRVLILVGIGVILVGGWYLANQLFLSPAPSRPVPSRPVLPSPQAKAPAPAPPVQPKAAAPAPAPAAAPPVKAEAKPAAPAPSGPPAKPTAPAQAPPEKTAAKAEKPPTPAAPKAEAKAAPKPAPAASAGFSLQMGAMVVEENAESLKRKLDESGFQSVLRKGTAFVTKHIVTVGEPTGKREAEDMSRRLNVEGFPSQLLAVEGKYTPQIGAFFNLDEAIDLARELQKKNFRPKITSKPVTTAVYQVRHGRFDSRGAALKRGEELKAKGYNFFVVRN